MSNVKLTLTPYQAKCLWAVVDGAVDAGTGSNPEREQRALNSVSRKLLDQHSTWKAAR